METAATIRDYIRDELLLGRDIPLRDDTPLWGNALDSVALMQLVTFVEDRFGIEVGDEELTSAAFGTLASITALVDRKVGGA